jgi:AraC-like DNA-binding protein/quercetin dioxygenase-like cupin family protein
MLIISGDGMNASCAERSHGVILKSANLLRICVSAMFGKSERRSDYQRTTRPVVAMARRLQHGDVTSSHRHRRAQLIYAASGVLSVEAQDGVWIVPPERGVWIPAMKRHGLRAASDVELHNVYVEPALAVRFSAECAVVAITPLLRALIGEAVAMPARYAADSRQARVLSLLLESIDVQPLPALTLPMPDDPRALRMALQVRSQPSVSLGPDQYADQTGASRRTIERLFRDQTGMPFGRWRQQALLIRALELLAIGTPVAHVASSLGYTEVAAFSSMFRRALGASPSRYFLR